MEFHIRSEELEQRSYLGSTYRGGTLKLSDIPLYEKVFEHKPRGVIAFRAFTSTSVKQNIALSFINKYPPKQDEAGVLFIFEIKTKTPTIVNISNASEYPGESEVLILPGNLFIIKNIKKDVQHPYEKKILTVTEIYLEYLHIPVSFRKKFMHTIHSARKDAVIE